MTRIPLAFLDLFRSLNSHGAKYMVVGGYAAIHHGNNRATGDLDIFIERTAQNAAAVCAAYHEFGLGRNEITPEDFLEDGTMIRAGVEPLRLEILNQISGVTFEACYPNRVQAEIDGVPFSIIGLEDLIANKLAAGRAKDLGDIKKLTKGAVKKVPKRKMR